MGCQKINFLDHILNQQSKFKTQNRVERNDDSPGTDNTNG